MSFCQMLECTQADARMHKQVLECTQADARMHPSRYCKSTHISEWPIKSETIYLGLMLPTHTLEEI